MNFVDRFLFLRKDAGVNKFRLHCRVGKDIDSVNRWVLYALRHSVRELGLSIVTSSGYPELQYGVLTCKTLVANARPAEYSCKL